MPERPQYAPADTPEGEPKIETSYRRDTPERTRLDTDTETPRVEQETAEQLDSLQTDITGRQIDAAARDGGPGAKKKEGIFGASEKAAAAAAGVAGGLGKIMEAFKNISDRLDPIRENLARALGPMLGTEIPGPLKTVLGVSSLGMLPMLERFTGKYGVFYKNLGKNKLKIADAQFSAKGFMAEYDAAVAQGSQLPFEEYVRRTAVHLHQQKGAGELTVNGNDLSAAAKAVVQAERKPETQTTK